MFTSQKKNLKPISSENSCTKLEVSWIINIQKVTQSYWAYTLYRHTMHQKKEKRLFCGSRALKWTKNGDHTLEIH